MLLDANLILSNNQDLAVAPADVPSSNVIDFLGLGEGQAPVNSFGITNTVFGQDIGIGDGVSPPNILCRVGTAFATAAGGTLQVKLQESVDSGAAGVPAYSANAWKTIAETDALEAAVLTAGAQIAEFTVPPRRPGQSFPRFFRLLYTVATGAFTAGTIGFAGILTGRDDAPAYPAAY